jgi:hypothetical protein
MPELLNMLFIWHGGKIESTLNVFGYIIPMKDSKGSRVSCLFIINKRVVL